MLRAGVVIDSQVRITECVVKIDLPAVRFLPKLFDRDHLLHTIGSDLGANR
jgi:hypothetical protein